jgi:membrane fusion protein, multidrug efflux system
MKMKLFLSSLLAALLITACNSTENVEKLETELEQKRLLLKQTEAAIKEIEGQIEVLKGGVDDRYFEPVVTTNLQGRMFRHFFEASGAVEPVREAFVSPEINGRIDQIDVREGDRVKKGQLLAKINTEVTEKTIKELETSLSLATDVFERQKRLWEQRIGSEIQFLEAKNNKENLKNRLATLHAQLDMAIITSPIDGHIEKISQKQGEMAAPGMVLMHIIDLTEMLIKADVSERFMPDINEGDEVVLRFPSYPGFSKTTTVRRIGNVVNPNNRTFEVELRLQNPNNMLKPNMVAVIDVNDYSADNSLVVPSKVIKEDLNGKYLYIAHNQNDDWIARKRYIVTGRTYLGETRIESGLNENDIVIVEGFNRVNDGSLLRISN